MYRFDEKKATQAMAQLLRRAGAVENYTKLLKILYLADRRAIIETGWPIAGARFCRMENGPLASDVYDCIKGNGDCPTWQRHIARSGRYDIRLVEDPGDLLLSDYEVSVLESVWEEHKSRNFIRMIDVVHELPEWEDPGKTSESLQPEEIMRGGGLEDDDIRDIRARNEGLLSAEALFR